MQARRPAAEKRPAEGRVQAKRPGAEKRVPNKRRQGPDWEQGARGGQQWEPAGQAKQLAVRGAHQERARVQHSFSLGQVKVDFDTAQVVVVGDGGGGGGDAGGHPLVSGRDLGIVSTALPLSPNNALCSTHPYHPGTVS